MAATMAKATNVIFFLAALVVVCSAGRYCPRSSIFEDNTYCVYGCCGIYNNYCCSQPSPVGLIVGLCVGGVVFLFFLILTICMCRKRRYGGFIYTSRPTAVVVQQQGMTSQNGVVSTAGVQPGVTYPPYQQYPYYPPAPGSYPSVAQTGYGYQSQPVAYPGEPPKYDSLNFDASGGVHNNGFDASGGVHNNGFDAKN